jgi:hypothetical protein
MMDEADIPDAAAAMAAAPDCAFACDGDVTLHCRASELPQLLPLLARWRGVAGLELITPDSTDSCLIPVAVGALGVLLQGMPLCTQLRLDGFTPHQFAPLLPALAGTAVDTIFLDHDHVTEPQLALWCAGQAGHCIRVVVTGANCELSGYLKEVLAAQTDVRLEVLAHVSGSSDDVDGTK